MTPENPFQDLGLTFCRMDRTSAVEIVNWRYLSPYDIYNLDVGEETVRYALDPRNNFHVMWDVECQLVGFCSFGQDAQVQGGDYGQEALDIGMGIRPDLTGQGSGTRYATAVISFARGLYNPVRYRVTIAAFNQRAQRVWAKIGFNPIQEFTNQGTRREFVVMVYEGDYQDID